MRVVIFTDTFLPKMDGIVRVICLLLDRLTERGIETAVVAPQLGPQPLERYNETLMISTNGPCFPWYPELKFAPPGLGVYRALQAFQPDVAHFIHPVVVGLPGMLMMQRMGVPKLVSFHLDYANLAQHMRYGPISLGFLAGFTNVATRFVFNRSDYNLAPSRAVQTMLYDLGVRQVDLWRRGVDAERFHPRFANAAMRARLSNGHVDDLLLLYVGRISPEKRLTDLLPLLEQVPHSRLAFVGDGPQRATLEALFPADRTVFTGYLHGDDLAAAYASADIFVFPSEFESFGLVVVEAMAAGLPVVASPVGGIPDVVVEGGTGYTFAVGDTAGLVRGVQQIAANSHNLAQMGQRARTFAETQTWPQMMDEVIVHYERLVAQRHS